MNAFLGAHFIFHYFCRNSLTLANLCYHSFSCISCKQMNTQHKYCYLDFDLDDTRSKLGHAAAFCHATNQRYGFSSSDLRQLGGSELKRIPDYLENDHEWKGRSIALMPVNSSRIVLQLHWEVAPLACENFVTLCCNDESHLRHDHECRP